MDQSQDMDAQFIINKYDRENWKIFFKIMVSLETIEELLI